MYYAEVLRAYTRNGGNGIANLIGIAKPSSLRVLNQNLEDIFLAAVGDESAAALDSAREG